MKDCDLFSSNVNNTNEPRGPHILYFAEYEQNYNSNFQMKSYNKTYIFTLVNFGFVNHLKGLPVLKRCSFC